MENKEDSAGRVVLTLDLPDVDLSHLPEELTLEGPIAASIAAQLQVVLAFPEEAKG